jgi:hypothetical protein
MYLVEVYVIFILKYIIVYNEIQARFNFVDFILHQNLHIIFIIHCKTHCIEMTINNIKHYFFEDEQKLLICKYEPSIKVFYF